MPAFTRRTLLSLMACLAAAAAGAQPAALPTKPVKIIVGFPAGGSLDAHARLLADRRATSRRWPARRCSRWPSS